MARYRMHLTLALIIIALSVWGCSTPSGNNLKMMQMDAKRITSDSGTIDVANRDFHEACMMMAKGETMLYSFTSTAPMDFNIHLHVDDRLIYPVKDDGVSTGDGSYTADLESHYCLMWTNTSGSNASLTYDFKLKEAE